MTFIKLALAFVLGATLFSCRSTVVKPPPTTSAPTIKIQKTEPVDPDGPVISEVEFKVKAKGESVEDYENGEIPWIDIENPNRDLPDLVDADKIVIPFKSAKVVIDYPLDTPDVFEIKASSDGFSRRQLITEISRRYREIYEIEERTATTKTVPLKERKAPINRNQTDGKFGICCHDLSDLDLGGIEVHKNAAGEITLILQIES